MAPFWLLGDQLCEAALAKTLVTCEKMVLMLDATPGMIAPAATATKPAMRAYSIRSWPWVSPVSRLSRFMSVVMK